jgi:hypothetical protein
VDQKLRLAGVSRGPLRLGFLEGWNSGLCVNPLKHCVFIPNKPRTHKRQNILIRDFQCPNTTWSGGAASGAAAGVFARRRTGGDAPAGAARLLSVGHIVGGSRLDGNDLQAQWEPQLDDGGNYRGSPALQEHSHQQ